jgi:hypothetical protein
LRGWPKTSGSRGMHVNVRIQRRWSFEQVRRAALALAREVEQRAPGKPAGPQFCERPPKAKFAADSPLEGHGFEIPVPRERGGGLSLHPLIGPLLGSASLDHPDTPELTSAGGLWTVA